MSYVRFWAWNEHGRQNIMSNKKAMLLLSGLTATSTAILAVVAILAYLKVDALEAPSPPHSLKGSMSDGEVRLQWSRPEYLARAVEEYYVLRRAVPEDPPGEFQSVDNVRKTTYTDVNTEWRRSACGSSNKPPCTYVYRIVAVRANGTRSPRSNYVKCSAVEGGPCTGSGNEPRPIVSGNGQ